MHRLAFPLHGQTPVFFHAPHLLFAQPWVVPQSRPLLGQTLEAAVSLLRGVDHLDGVLVWAVEHAELRLRLVVGLVVVAEVGDTLLLVSGFGAINLVLLGLQVQIVSLLLEVLEVDLLAPELEHVVLLALVHVAQLAQVDLDGFVGTHFGHSVGEVVEVVLGGEAHVPLLVHRHHFVEVAGLVALAAQFELALLAPADDRLDV